MLAHALGVYYTGDAITDTPSLATVAAVNELYKCAGAFRKDSTGEKVREQKKDKILRK